ncbi:SDR family oxidoreductase [Nonomuraea endophytica]|uniref:SDR family oxidoreductase n=1 Tax=Nonomuraea endophytica TaxID=714136 RepID=UPI0037CBA5DA
MTDLSGKGALVTGGSRGIGRAVVERLAADGAQVVFTYRSDAAAAREVSESTGAHAIQADQGTRADLDRLFAEAEKILPGLDILVNNAAESTPTLIGDIDDETFDRVFNVNAKATFLAIQWAARVMRDGGRIINLSTLNTAMPAPGLTLYAGSKAAVEQFAKVAARELGGRGITVNVVSPGATDTDMLRSTNPPEALAAIPAYTALQRLGSPTDVASVIALLCTPDAAWLTGQTLLATGGLFL